MTERAIVATFHRSASGMTRLYAVTAVSDFECSDGRVIRTCVHYDVDWSKSCDCYLFHRSGHGGGEPVEVEGLFFASGPVQVERKPSMWCSPGGEKDVRGTRRIRRRNPTRRMMKLPRHIALDPGHDLLNWLELENVQQDAVWCHECHENVRGDYLCAHIWWCEKIGWYSTPSEPCGHERGDCES